MNVDFGFVIYILLWIRVRHFGAVGFQVKNQMRMKGEGKKEDKKMTRLGLDPRTLSESVAKLLTIRDNQLHHPADC